MPSLGTDAPALRSTPVAISPDFRRLLPPFIIVGMHRSGTSMVAGMLHLLGAYVDPDFPTVQMLTSSGYTGDQIRQSGYGEAICFRLLNEEVLARAGANWYHPTPFMEKRDLPRFQTQCLQTMAQATFHTLNREFLKPLQAKERSAWGWKDPRNSLTLSYWLTLFPEAKVIHVRRNPDAIAESLMHRARMATSAPSSSSASLAQRLYKSVLHPTQTAKALQRRIESLQQHPQIQPYSMLDKEDCLALSQIYVRECLSFRKLEAQYMEVWYEDIIQEPEEYANRFTELLTLSPTPDQIVMASRFVTPSNTSPRRKEPLPCR